MTLLTVLEYPDPRLLQPAAAVDPTQIDAQFAADLLETMVAYTGFGLAATQVGRAERYIAVLLSNKPSILVNPEIVSSTGDSVIHGEGCLSFPDLFLPVARNRHVIVDALDLAGQPVRFAAADMDAVVLQHEIDHLAGILFTKRVSRLRRDLELKKWGRHRHAV